MTARSPIEEIQAFTKLNLGCGVSFYKDYLNVNYWENLPQGVIHNPNGTQGTVLLNWDLRSGIPVANDTIDLILVPALAVDRSGNRLGKGKGFYDRFLAECNHPKLIAVVFDDEVFDSIPTEPFDKPVDGVVTPSGWWLVQSR